MPVSVSGPLVSIIVPVHNAASSLHRALRSVLSQTLTDYELILVDDCSADESIRMLKKYGELDERVRLFSTSRNSGPGAARNVGLKNARGRYIAFLDADDFWVRNKLELQVRSFEDDKVILSHTRVVLLNTRGNIVGIVNGRKKMQLFDMYVGNRVTDGDPAIGRVDTRSRRWYGPWRCAWCRASRESPRNQRLMQTAGQTALGNDQDARSAPASSERRTRPWLSGSA